MKFTAPMAMPMPDNPGHGPLRLALAVGEHQPPMTMATSESPVAIGPVNETLSALTAFSHGLPPAA